MLNHIFKLGGGALLANFLPILLLPLLLRYYDPVDFGLLSVYTAIITVIGQVGTLKYDQAILVAKDAEDAQALFTLGLMLGLLLSGLGLLAYYVIIHPKFSHIVVLFLGSVLQAGISCAYSFGNYRMNIKAMNLYSMLPMPLYTIIAIILVFVGFDFYNLVLARLLALLFTFLMLIAMLDLHLVCNFQYLKDTAKKYIEYPKVILPAKSINLFSTNGLNLMLPLLFSLNEVGLVNIAFRFLRLPEMVLSRPLDSILRRSSFEDGILNRQKLYSTYRQVLRWLAPLLISGSLFYYLSLDIQIQLLSQHFEKWISVIEIIKVLLPSFVVSALVITYMSIFRLVNAHKLELLFQVTFLLSIILFSIMTYFIELEFLDSLILFSILRVSVFGFCGYLILKLIVKRV